MHAYEYIGPSQCFFLLFCPRCFPLTVVIDRLLPHSTRRFSFVIFISRAYVTSLGRSVFVDYGKHMQESGRNQTCVIFLLCLPGQVLFILGCLCWPMSTTVDGQSKHADD
jgi:hypothetical protein